MNRARICLVVSQLHPLGGVERVWLTLAEEFIGLGYDVDLVTVNEPALRTTRLPQGVYPKNLGVARLRQVVGPFRAYLRARKPTLVIPAVWPLNVLCALGAKLERSSALVCVTEHSILSAHYRDWGMMHRVMLRASLAIGYRLADLRVAVSHGAARDVAQLAGLNASKIDVIHNPIPMPKDTKVASEAEKTWPKYRSVARLISVGNLKPPKNHALLIDALATVRRRLPAHLVVLGQGAERAALEAQIDRLGLGPHVSLPGHRSDPAAWMRSADVFVLSSRHEGFGNVLIEAMATGLPVVSTDCPAGPAEILDKGRFGTLCPADDPDALADAIISMLSDPTPPEALRKRASEFAPRKAALRYLQLAGLAPHAQNSLDAE